MTTLAASPFSRKRVMLRRSTQQINDPVVIKNKYKAKKSVRFNDHEQVRYFYKSHTPKQARQDPPFVEYSVEDYQLMQPGWPARSHFLYNNHDTKIRMENVQLLDGDDAAMFNNQFILEGRCKAFTTAAEASIHVRYTFDLWKTFREEQAQYHDSTHNWSRYYFNIPVDATLETKTIYMALRYTVNGQDYWDNNNGKNYEVIIKPKESTLEEHSKTKEDIKILAKRYDFTASLSAARKPWSPPPSPPGSPMDDGDHLNYTPPLFFHSGMTTPPTPNDMPVSQLETVPKSFSLLSIQDPIPSLQDTIPINHQMSYTDFVNKYCFYNPHSTMYPSVIS